MNQIFIKAINPGYTVDELKNVGEFIELARADSDDNEPISLAGLKLGYTNSSGNFTLLLEFSADSWLTGENLLLRLASSPDSEQSNAQYSKTLALKAGPLLLTDSQDAVLSSLCWTGAEECSAAFDSSRPTSLVFNPENNQYEHVENYEPDFAIENYLEQGKGEDETTASQCSSIEFSEILSFYESDQSEQFIEFYNSSSEQVLLDGCQIKYKNKYHTLTGIIKPQDYFVYYPTDFTLTKNPTTSNTLELVDTTGDIVDTLNYPNGQQKSTSYAKIGYDETGQPIWKNTFDPTPGSANNYQQYKTCEEGKAINAETGNCVKITTETETVCPEGKYLNPLTGRCKAYEVEEEKTCADGYELNPETNRCRKIKTNTGADYEIEDAVYSQTSNFIALNAIIVIVIVGIAYIVIQFRKEIKKFLQKLKGKFKRNQKEQK